MIPAVLFEADGMFRLGPGSMQLGRLLGFELCVPTRPCPTGYPEQVEADGGWPAALAEADRLLPRINGIELPAPVAAVDPEPVKPATPDQAEADSDGNADADDDANDGDVDETAADDRADSDWLRTAYRETPGGPEPFVADYGPRPTSPAGAV